MACIRDRRIAQSVFEGKPEGKRPLERPRRRLEVNTEIDYKEIGWENVDWIYLSQGREKWRAVLNAVINFRAP